MGITNLTTMKPRTTKTTTVSFSNNTAVTMLNLSGIAGRLIGAYVTAFANGSGTAITLSVSIDGTTIFSGAQATTSLVGFNAFGGTTQSYGAGVPSLDMNFKNSVTVTGQLTGTPGSATILLVYETE